MTMMNEGENEDEDNYDDGKQKNDDEEENYEYFGQKLQWQGDSGSPLVLPINGRFQVN